MVTVGSGAKTANEFVELEPVLFATSVCDACAVYEPFGRPADTVHVPGLRHEALRPDDGGPVTATLTLIPTSLHAPENETVLVVTVDPFPGSVRVTTGALVS